MEPDGVGKGGEQSNIRSLALTFRRSCPNVAASSPWNSLHKVAAILSFGAHDGQTGSNCRNQGITRFDRYRATADSSRLHMDSPSDPSASTPSVVGSGVGTVSAVFDSSTVASSCPFVWPAMMGLFGMVS
jgi:hypothetical protein